MRPVDLRAKGGTRAGPVVGACPARWVEPGSQWLERRIQGAGGWGGQVERGPRGLAAPHPSSEPPGPPGRLPISRSSTTARGPAAPARKCSAALISVPSSIPSPCPPFPPALNTRILFPSSVLSAHGGQPRSPVIRTVSSPGSQSPSQTGRRCMQHGLGRPRTLPRTW